MKKIVVLAKQVPDTSNIKGNAMKDDGTVNRAALPAIFNPEDLNALETGLEIKDSIGAYIIVLTMGPPAAVEILKHALYMGADEVILLSDRKFAGSDTLATSYVLAGAVEKIGNVDLVLAGSQAIDGDTAQVGPQVADKIGFNQVTYVSKVEWIGPDYLIVERDSEFQIQRIKIPYHALLTITSAANAPRYPNCLNMLKYFRANLENKFTREARPTALNYNWIIPTMRNGDLGLDESRCGIKGSPTRVFKIKNITLKGGELKFYGTEPTDIKQLVKDIRKDYAEISE